MQAASCSLSNSLVQNDIRDSPAAQCRSDEFAAKEAEVAPLMQRLTTILGKNITLINFW